VNLIFINSLAVFILDYLMCNVGISYLESSCLLFKYHIFYYEFNLTRRKLMKVSRVAIQNFRKLKKVDIDFSSEQTVFVGANNSGKTSAMDALIYFLDRDKYSGSSRSSSGKIGRKLCVTDFTISNWLVLNNFAESWVSNELESKGCKMEEWAPLCPSLDVWIEATIDDISSISHLIPTLDWNGEPLGIRLIFQPKDLDDLRANYVENYLKVTSLLDNQDNQDNQDKGKEEGNSSKPFMLWPRNLKDFLSKELARFFEIKAYLQPSTEFEKNEVSETCDFGQDLSNFPFSGLFKVDVIDAQRGFADLSSNGTAKNESLSPLLSDYYDNHLNPSELPEEGDIKALKAIDSAQNEFDERLKEAFDDTISEIETLGYPGFSDPHISLSTKLDPKDALGHEAAVLFSSSKGDDSKLNFELPEGLNGLGYKNLIFMVFKLISFRDKWLLKGKAHKKNSTSIEPLHLVFIEEPEAHLHAQVQQVFIRKAFEVLRKDVPNKFNTQLIISSHSSYLAHEVEFEKLRYFKRSAAENSKTVPTSVVVNMSKVFSTKSSEDLAKTQTAQFVSRYIKTTHCDLFFANGIIMVEGAAERMLLPYFIKKDYSNRLNNSYISILEVGGAHAHRFKSLIKILGLPTLVITDADAQDSEGKKAQPRDDKSYQTGSDTLKSWLGFKEKNFSEILALPFKDKVKDNVCAVYQYDIKVSEFGNNSAIPYTFEDALALSNISIFKTIQSATGMIKKMKVAAEKDSLSDCSKLMYEALKDDKAKMALDILYDIEPSEFNVPLYISEGLNWLDKELDLASMDYLNIEGGHSNGQN
jgi:predicted ATP-dependent endonuclease of OLD family